MTSAVELTGVVKTYGRRRALDGLSLTVPQGSIFGLIGSNGAGKTTALCAIMGLLKIQAGSINLFGEGPFDPHRHAGIVSILPQDSQLPEHATLEQLLTYYARLQGISRSNTSAQVERVLKLVHLTDRKKDKMRALSHGMRKRAAIAQAFLGDPHLVLLDEPLNGLDPVEVATIRTLIKNRMGKQTTIISSHILKEVEAVCDYVAFIEQGKLVRQDHLHHITRSQTTMNYLLEENRLDVEKLKMTQPGLAFFYHPESKTLTVEYDSHVLNQATVNKEVLTALMAQHVGIMEVRPGSDLEEVYLNMQKH